MKKELANPLGMNPQEVKLTDQLSEDILKVLGDNPAYIALVALAQVVATNYAIEGTRAQVTMFTHDMTEAAVAYHEVYQANYQVNAIRQKLQ